MPGPSEGTCICVVGTGYVGETLLQQFGRVFDSIGYDISEKRVEELREKYGDHKRIRLTNNPRCLARGTHFLIAVPTPLRDDHSVNLSFVVAALDTVVAWARRGSGIVIESSVPVGTTRALLGPYESIFDCGMSPERIDPGREQPAAHQIPKVISALSPRSLKILSAVYSRVYDTLVPVSKPEVAEMTKLHENCYRMVNIAYVNEISDACVAHGIDPHEMIQAAATKPFGFQLFTPGLGVGGHCLPVNPWYLFHNSRRLPVLELATKLMAQRPQTKARAFHRQCRRLHRSKVAPATQQPRVLIVGLGFKAGQSNIAHSPALSFARKLEELGCERLAFYDPSIAADEVDWMEKLSELCWTSAYLDNKFDAIAWCNDLPAIHERLLSELSRVAVKKFNW